MFTRELTVTYITSYKVWNYVKVLQLSCSSLLTYICHIVHKLVIYFRMPLKFCANLSFMFQETASLLERYGLAKEAGFKAVECAFPYDYGVEKVVEAKKNAGVEQILINAYVGE